MPKPITKNSHIRFKKCEAVIDKWLTVDADKMAEAMAEIKREGWWLVPDGPPTFALYVQQRFGKSARTARRWIASLREPGTLRLPSVLPMVKIGDDEIILTSPQQDAIKNVPDYMQEEVVRVAVKATTKDGEPPKLTTVALKQASKSVKASELEKGSTGLKKAAADKGAILRQIHQLQAVKRDVEQSKERYAYRYVLVDIVSAHLLNTIRELRAGAGYCECLYCREGTKERETCEACSGEGWLPRRLFDRADDKRKKEVRRI